MPRLKLIRISAVVLATCWFSYSLWLVVKGWCLPFPNEFHVANYKIQQAIAWSVWTIAAPVWFLFEYYIFNQSESKATPELLEKFKNNQDLAGKCWVAVAAVLLALYFGRDMKP
jgi:hypothetical protein